MRGDTQNKLTVVQALQALEFNNAKIKTIETTIQKGLKDIKNKPEAEKKEAEKK